MKRLLLLFLLLPALANAQTFVPGQLLTAAELNAAFAATAQLAGSTFTGPVTIPNLTVTGTASIPASSIVLPAQPSNTVLANFTSGTAVPSGSNTVPSCSTATSALQYTTGAGFGCLTTSASTLSPLSQFAATTSAQLAGVLSDETGTGVAVFATSPTITTPNLVGTTTNNNAAVGSVGEYVTATNTAISLTNGTPYNGASISLTAGDWDVQGTISFIGGTGASSSVMNASISTTSATQNSAIGFMQSSPNSTAAATTTRLSTPVVRMSLATTTTVYLVGVDTFAGGTVTSDALIRARRIR